ncbi:MAG: calcium/sodium antiporter [Paracoccaceae bacterium]|nr:calcium/sodium antiporter [Paracoccaceae bacterium]
MDLFYVALGLVLLVFAGDALVKGAVNLSLRLGIPALVVGLTVVAFGTSAPEMLVSVQAVLDNAPGIALGNVVGSNIANVLLVLGISALLSTIHSSQLDLTRSYLTMLAAAVLFMGLCYLGPITWWHGLILLTGLALMLWDSFRHASEHGSEEDTPDIEGTDLTMPWWKIGAFLAGGLVGLPVGADFLVEGSINIARVLGISETVIGLTLVAIGTSLPELATSIAAALRGKADVAMGNVIGSNVFNLLGIIGVAGLVGDLSVPEAMLSRDLWVMLGVSLLLVPFVLMKRDITRGVGFGFIGLYAAYAAVLVL